jgi:hypothetical protein
MSLICQILKLQILHYESYCELIVLHWHEESVGVYGRLNES